MAVRPSRVARRVGGEEDSLLVNGGRREMREFSSINDDGAGALPYSDVSNNQPNRGGDKRYGGNDDGGSRGPGDENREAYPMIVGSDAGKFCLVCL